MPLSIALFTFIPSPYQVELFDAIARKGVDISVVYAQRSSPERSWECPKICHNAYFLDELPFAKLCSLSDDSDVCVFSWYQKGTYRRLMRRRELLRKPWAFWGERPGIGRWGTLGKVSRRLAMKSLWKGTAPIWGIGQWAVDGFQEEFGHVRRYFNVPYSSDLSRFAAVRDTRLRRPQRVLFSGSLIDRKGVELLAHAWLAILPKHPNAHLSLVGNGPLRERLTELLGPVARSVKIQGFVPWNDLPLFYGSSDLLCAPSRYDGWGLIVPEAMASGLPVIASRSMGSSREMLREGVNGWVVDPESLPQLVAKLDTALRVGESEYSKMSIAASTSAMHFNLTEGSERFIRAAVETSQIKWGKSS